MITSVRSESFPFHRLALTLAALFMASGSALASEANGLYWLFQRTGYSSGYTPFGQTAVAMGDSKSWPVVFSLSSSSTVQASTVQAYTLSPVNNPVTKTFWKQIGTNVITGTGFSILTAKSSSDGRVGAVLRNSLDTSLYPNPNSYVAAVGRRSTGFTAPLANVAGIAFDAAGNLVTASASTLAGSGTYSLSAVRSIAVTPWGDIGVLNFLQQQKVFLSICRITMGKQFQTAQITPSGINICDIDIRFNTNDFAALQSAGWCRLTRRRARRWLQGLGRRWHARLGGPGGHSGDLCGDLWRTTIPLPCLIEHEHRERENDK